MNRLAALGLKGLIPRDQDTRRWPLPEQVKRGDIGLDLYVSDQVVVPPFEWRGIPSRVRVAAPAGIWFMIIGRSSALHRRGLMVIPSVIDSGFRGQLFAMSFNITDNPVCVEPGERLAQLIPMYHIPFRFEETDVLPGSERGESGFGSTGT